MDSRNKKNSAAAAPPERERRRIATVVRDERGNAVVAWRDAPADHARPVLELEEQAVLALHRAERGFDPYARNLPRAVVAGGPRPAPKTAPRTDLRRLSEWIKMMRTLEQRRRQGDDD